MVESRSSRWTPREDAVLRKMAEAREMKKPVVRPATQSNADREFRSQGIEWRWFMILLFAFAIINYLAGRG
jgi:hypothetical protein